MKTLLRSAAMLGVMLSGLAPVASFADTPIGMFQPPDRDMDYQVTYCGTNDKQLCVKLLAVRGKASTKNTRAMLNKMIVDHASPTGTNTWKGNISLFGYSGSGDLTLHPGKELLMHGCVMIFACTDQRFIPAQ